MFLLSRVFVFNYNSISEQKKKDISMCKEAINRWTENIFSVQSWCKNKFGIETKTMCQNFGIPEELDYIE